MAVRRQENELAFWNRRRISISWPSRHRVLPIILRTETGDTDSDQGDEQSCVGSIQHADVVNGAMSEPPIRNERGGGWCREEVRVGGLWTEQRAARAHYAPKVRLLVAPLGIEQRRFVLTKAERRGSRPLMMGAETISSGYGCEATLGRPATTSLAPVRSDLQARDCSPEISAPS